MGGALALIPSPGGHNDDYAGPALYRLTVTGRHNETPTAPYLLIAAAVGTFFVCNAAAQETCKPTTIGTVSVAAVRDGRTIALADGRELRLAGIEVTGDSRAVWQALVAGHPLRLERLGPGQDRYGRLVAFAFTGDAGPSVQQAMLEQGQARVSARVGDKACAEGLLSTEKAARAAGRGLWADPNFAPLSGITLGQIP